MAYVYVLHFERPVWGTCQHYVGYTELLEDRLRQHRTGHGGRICNKAVKLGIQFEVVHVEEFPTYKEAIKREREIKRRVKVKGGLCTLCKEDKYVGKDSNE